MTTSTCTTCGGELLTSSGQTFCPACLLQQGMKSSTYGGNGPRVAWKPPEIERLSAAFPQLEIQQLLGVGGMGAVFKVRQKELDRIAALKVLPGEMAADAGFTERFLREARLLASLSHPHIVTVYEFGQRDSIYFLLMEFIDGVTLRQALRAEPIKKLGSKETLAIVGQLCDALQFAHDEGVVHRDIKPENILIDKRGRVKIADFGLARLLGQSPTMPTLTGTHQLMGTPAYMAPEQIEGLPGIDHRADIYSMGVVFYELLTGELPLGRFSPPSERAETDVRLDEVVLRTLAREPDRRYQQASQVKTDVEALRGPALAALSSPIAPAKKRRVGLFVSAFALGALMTPFVGAAMWLAIEWAYESTRPVKVSGYIAAVHADRASNEAEAQLRSARSLAAKRDNEPTGAASPSDGGKMSGTGGEGESGMMGMGGVGVSMSPNAFDSGSAIVFENSVPLLNAQLFNLTDEQRTAVNAILKDTHERYLKEEALHSIVSVDANGVQTTKISAFPDQLRAIENELWTKLDDAVPVETQKEFRNRLNLYTTDGQSDDSGSMGMGSSGMGMSGGMMEPKNAIHPGLLGWETYGQQRIIEISRTGRWYQWSIATDKTKAHYLIGRQRTPTLPAALQRFYREPGPWMAVANARATYGMKNWMQVSDYFSAESMTREWVIAMADAEGLNEKLEVNSTDVQKRFSQRVEEETRRTAETAEMVRIGSGEEYKQSDFNNTHLRPLMSELAGVSAASIDGPIERVTKAIPLQTLKQHFGFQVLVRWLFTVQGLDGASDFAALYGEVSSYTETGDTASATLTIPNKPPVPIRFKRENGQWKIDAIGSNERLLERLKQTKIWKQHAEIEAVLENARTAYAAKEWQKLADCFTRTGKYRWALRTHSMMPIDASPLPEEEGKLRMEKFLTETGRWAIQHAAAEKSDEKSLPEDKDGKEWRILFDQFLNCPANESNALLIKLTERLPESSVDAMFASTAIQSIVLPPAAFQFGFHGCRVTDVKLTDDIATANLVRKEGTPTVPVRLLKQDGQWKIDAIGSPEELQQQTRLAHERQNGASPRAAVEAFREALADGRFQTALNCMTEDARNEWLGEILVSFVHSMGMRPLASRFPTDEPLFGLEANHPFLKAPSPAIIKLSTEAEVYGNFTIDCNMRRKVCIDLALTVSGIDKLLHEFMDVRLKQHPDSFAEYTIGEFEEVPDRTGPKGAMKYRLQPASPEQQPLELDIVEIDGLWKLNTIIDPALKPWPLVDEPSTPETAAESM